MKALRRFIIVLVILAGVFVAADFGARWYVSSEMEDRVRRAAGYESNVEIRGFPVLFQLAGGRFSEVVITLPRFTYEDKILTEVTTTVYDLNTSTPYKAGHLRARATISSADLNEMYQQYAVAAGTLSASNGKLRLTGEILGGEFGLTFLPKVDGQSIVLQPSQIVIAGFPVDISGLSGVFGPLGEIVTIPFKMPDGLQLTNVEVTGADLHVWAEGSQVELANLAP